ncbi:condensation domain-containing protein, partial [Chitinophaga sp. CF118]|uniref:condensation domain-containing protein n=1 Tax=Chitinophaga sp. CF118 TaxID=1884367 RepID=UPI002101666E
MPGVFVFEGELDLALLEYAFDELIARHESLRTIFREDEEGEVRQVILDTIPFNIACYDMQADETILKSLLQQAVAAPFELSAGPLLRAGLYQVGTNKWIFTFTIHHIISDGWSMNVFIKELLLFYNTASNPLSPLKIQYKDYAFWQQEQLSEAALEEHATYWLNQFSDELPVLVLPADKARPALKSYNGGIVYKTINRELTRGLKTLMQEQQSTLFMGLLCAVNTLLHRYSGQEDIIIGSPVAGREHIELEDQIGFYVNTLVLRTRFSGKDSYLELLENVKQITLNAYEHQVYPFDTLVDLLQLQRDLSRSPLFDVMVALQDKNSGPLQLNNLSVSEYTGHTHTVSKFDLLFNFSETGEEITTAITYNSDIYTKETIDRLSIHFVQLLEAVTNYSYQPIEELEYLSEAETARLLSVFNNTSVPYPSDK